jgi:hypothetical protein
MLEFKMKKSLLKKWYREKNIKEECLLSVYFLDKWKWDENQIKIPNNDRNDELDEKWFCFSIFWANMRSGSRRRR